RGQSTRLVLSALVVAILQPATAVAQEGLLLGLASANDAHLYDSLPQPLRTFWITSGAGALPLVRTGLLVPQGAGFSRIVISRTCRPGPSPRPRVHDNRQVCSDSLYIQPAAAPVPVRLRGRWHDNPCSGSFLSITF